MGSINIESTHGGLCLIFISCNCKEIPKIQVIDNSKPFKLKFIILSRNNIMVLMGMRCAQRNDNLVCIGKYAHKIISPYC